MASTAFCMRVQYSNRAANALNFRVESAGIDLFQCQSMLLHVHQNIIKFVTTPHESLNSFPSISAPGTGRQPVSKSLQ